MTWSDVFVLSILAAGPAMNVQLARQVPGGAVEAVPEGAAANGRVRGQVVTKDGIPLRRVILTLDSIHNWLDAATDADGRYEFVDVPPGDYSLTAKVAGFLDATLGTSTSAPDQTPITVAASRRLELPPLVLSPTLAITGRVFDERGYPVVGAHVSAHRIERVGGRNTLPPADEASTDDRGQFRLYALTPGDYTVCAEVSWSATRTNQHYLPRGLTGGYALTCYPGTSSPADATFVRLIAGEADREVNLQLTSSQDAPISGVVIGVDGQPDPHALLSLTPVGGGSSFSGVSATTRDDGSFSILSVPSGRYLLSVQGFTRGRAAGWECPPLMAASLATAAALQPIVVEGGATDVVVTTSAGSTVTGKVRFEGALPPAVLLVTAHAAQGAGIPVPIGCSTVDSQGVFKLAGLISTMTFLRIEDLPDGYVLRAVEQHGDDVTDTGVDTSSGHPIDGLVLVVTDQRTEVRARVTEASGMNASAFTLVVFAQDSSRWRLPWTRWVATALPEDTGRARVTGLPPGDYYVIATSEAAERGWNDPATLDRLSGQAQRVTIGKGEQQAVNLTVVR